MLQIISLLSVVSWHEIGFSSIITYLMGCLQVIVGIMLRHHSLLRSDTGRTIVLLPNLFN